MRRGSAMQSILIAVIVLIFISLSATIYFLAKNNIISPIGFSSSTLHKTDVNVGTITTQKITYKDTDFTIEVPKDWYINPSEQSVNIVNYSQEHFKNRGLPVYQGPEKDKGILQLVVLIQNSDKSLVGYVSDRKTAYIKDTGSADSWTETNVTIDGQKAIQVKNSSPSWATSYFVKHPKKNVIITIVTTFDFDNFDNIRKQFLSTFKFQ